MGHREHDALQILRDALDTDPGERDSFLSDRCGADTDLRERVDALLRGIAEEDLASVAADGFDGSRLPRGDEVGDDRLLDTLLGPFRVVERIGRGGMGIVYRGVREGADFDQQVAIKLIRRGYDFDDIRARFVRERRILARLTHPNLARFIDGGVAADGRPWFALEFVRGETITRWCDAQRLDIRARIRLFMDVCAAVQYAHTQLVVHRDIKPGNVLVDESGAVRLLDFGVAGLLTGDADDESQPSTIGVHPALTPEYAAPEQLAGQVVGVSADVYALGVVLYELLSGALPHAFDRRAMDAPVRAMHETPQSLASAINRAKLQSDLHAGAASDALARARAQCRRIDPRTFRRLVRGDLSRILQKALANEPARRYNTVALLSDDLDAWLRGAPVRATGNALGYRASKFVTRHRAGVAAAVGAAAMLAAFTIFHAITLNAELARTQTERNRSEASLGLMRKLLESPDPQTGVGPDTTLGEFLQSSAASITQSSSLDAQVRDELELTLASSLKSIDRYDAALAIARPISEAASDSPRAWTTRVRAATLVGEIQTLKGDYSAAVAQFTKTQALADKHAISDPLTMATLLSEQSIAYNHLAQWDQSAELIDRAVAIARPLGKADPEFVANLIGFQSIPRAYPKTDLPKAESFLHESLSYQESHGLAASGVYANTLGELAQVTTDQGRFEDAEPILLDAIKRMKQIFGAQHRETSFKLSDAALLYFRWNRLDEARRWRDEATTAMVVSLGDKHPFVALSLMQSASLAFFAGDLARAAADSAASVAIADIGDRKAFSEQASLYGAAERCANNDATAVQTLRERVTALNDTFNVRAFDVRLAAANCLDHYDRHDDALAAIEPFARKLADHAPLSRNDYIVPSIERVRARAPK